ncbi:restriction endonuclease subunit S [Vibrio chagasii]|uniref:restriction endonuclease subunit S n=1 Tax=Vibrio chagasii TaxID=170679 RepID=UPI003736461A
MTEQQLPEGWQVVKFGDIAKQISKRVEPSETELKVYVGLEHLDPNRLKIKRHGVPADVKGQKLLVKRGQIIFGKRRAYQRKVAVADWDCICSAHAMVLEAKSDSVIPEFLAFFMQSDSFMNRAVEISEGSLSPTIKWKVLEKQKFRIPSLEQQEKLLRVFNKIQSNEADLELATEHCVQLKKSFESKLISGLISRGLSAEPGFQKLSDLGEFKNGLNKDKDSFGSGTPFVNLDDVFASNIIDNVPEGLVECSQSDIENYALSQGDILFVRSSVKPSGVAKTSLVSSVDESIVFSGFLIRFRPKDIRYSEFFNFVFNSSAFRHRISAFVTVSANSNINQKALQAQKIKIPPLKDIEMICSSLRNIDAQFESLCAQLDALRKVQKSILEG